MRRVIILLAFACTSACGDDWVPPENPGPECVQSLLLEAAEDIREERYELALSKHVWFHENALSFKRHGVGSFALVHWNKLAEEYPQALTKLKEVRDQAKRKVMEGDSARESFHTLASIDDRLGEHAATRRDFELLDEKSPELAKDVFDVAKPSLLQAKSYAILGKYAEPKDDFVEIRDMYRRVKYWGLADKRFANDAMTLVATLAVNGRRKEAEEIAALARAEWDNRSFRADLREALEGVFPGPRP